MLPLLRLLSMLVQLPPVANPERKYVFSASTSLAEVGEKDKKIAVAAAPQTLSKTLENQPSLACCSAAYRNWRSVKRKASLSSSDKNTLMIPKFLKHPSSSIWKIWRTTILVLKKTKTNCNLLKNTLPVLNRNVITVFQELSKALIASCQTGTNTSCISITVSCLLEVIIIIFLQMRYAGVHCCTML